MSHIGQKCDRLTQFFSTSEENKTLAKEDRIKRSPFYVEGDTLTWWAAGCTPGIPSTKTGPPFSEIDSRNPITRFRRGPTVHDRVFCGRT